MPILHPPYRPTAVNPVVNTSVVHNLRPDGQMRIVYLVPTRRPPRRPSVVVNTSVVHDLRVRRGQMRTAHLVRTWRPPRRDGIDAMARLSPTLSLKLSHPRLKTCDSSRLLSDQGHPRLVRPSPLCPGTDNIHTSRR
ncbi:MAG: hypothetical protein FWD11_02685 [Micrococcales bacterium]|nr:hypothetical protein [Micrococcales bacterium]